MTYDEDTAKYAKSQALFWLEKADDRDPDRQDGSTCALISIGHALIAIREELEAIYDVIASISGNIAEH